MTTPVILDKRAARRAFARSARRYDDAAILQRLVCDRTLENLEPLAIKPRSVLDLGCGTGYGTVALGRMFPRASITALDYSLPMLVSARRKQRRLFARECYICADAEALPFVPGCFDLAVSSLMLQWCAEPDPVLAGIRDSIRAGGAFIFSTFGPNTLRELRTAWDAAGPVPRVHPFIDMHDLGDALVRAGFVSPVLDTEVITVRYDEVIGLMRDLKDLGAVNANLTRPRGLLGRSMLQAAITAYEDFRGSDGKLPSTWEVVYGHCWVPMPGSRPQDGSTVASFPLADLRRRDR